MKKLPTISKFLYYLLKTRSIYLIMLICFFILLYLILLLPIVVPSFCCVWKLLLVHFENFLWMVFVLNRMFQCLEKLCLYSVETGSIFMLAKFLFSLRWYCLFLLKFLFCPFLLLLFFYYKLALVWNLDWKTLCLSSSQYLLNSFGVVQT